MLKSGMQPPQAGIADDLTIDADLLQSTKPTLYIGIIGTLVLQEGANFRVAPFAREFINCIRERFRMTFLTRLSETAAREVARLVDAEISYTHHKKGLGKVSGIDFARNFIWIDDAPNSRDLMRLAEERCSAQLITVNGKDGVTRSTLKKVEACLESLASQPI
ncbi:MAG: hypothetical protein H6807_17970 [Planctomycetes bacterium]|nr:hypothetical protein [Planctomycetota bacterium]